MKQIITLLLGIIALTTSSLAQADLATIKGKVFEGEGRSATVPAAKVWLDTENGPRTVITDNDGNFKIDALRPGIYNLFVKSIGYDTLKITGIELNSGILKVIDANLVQGRTLAEIPILGNPLITKDIPRLLIPTEDIAHSPLIQNPKGLLAAVSSDIQLVEGTGELIIRGSRPGDAIYYIDGVKATDLSAVPGVSIRGMQAYTGGIPANYGDTTGGVVVLETKSYFDLYYAWRANR